MKTNTNTRIGKQNKVYFATSAVEFKARFFDEKIVPLKTGETIQPNSQDRYLGIVPESTSQTWITADAVVKNNIKEDDKIREYIIKTTKNTKIINNKEFVAFSSKIYKEVLSLYKEFFRIPKKEEIPKEYKKVKNVEKFILSSLFRNYCQNLLDSYVESYYIKKMPQDFTLNPTQQSIVEDLNIFAEDIKNNILFLINLEIGTRAGKTLGILTWAYSQNLVPIWAAKELTANNSAEKDHRRFFPNDEFQQISLHSNNKDKLSIKTNKKCVLVIDEADSASHTPKSIKKLLSIIKNHNNVVGVITMSATRSHRGAKILNKIEKYFA